MTMDRRTFTSLGALGAASLAATPLLSGCKQHTGDVMDILIIGAGLSGLAAGWELKKGGFKNFKVLEARDRVGGRTLNQVVNDAPVESGATWIGPGQTAIYNLCRELGIDTFHAHWSGDAQLVEGGVVHRLSGDLGPPIQNPALLAKLETLAKTVPVEAPWTAPNAAALDAKTFGQFLLDEGMPQEEFHVFNLFAAQTFGARPDQLSLLFVLHYIHAAGSYTLLESMDGGAQQDRIVGGSQAPSLALRDRLGQAVRLGSPVTKISNWNDHGSVRVETSEGVVEARRVILALSPSQAGEIKFDPPLPAARQAILDGWPRGGSGFTMHFGYHRPFWRDAGLSGLAVELLGDISMLIADLSPPDGSTGIIKTLGLAGIGGPPEARKEAALKTLVKCFGPEAATPTEWVFQDWSKERYTRGCVSPIGPGFLSKVRVGLGAPTGALHWAGTETSTIWMGYMDGAVRAGRRAAVEALGTLVGRS